MKTEIHRIVESAEQGSLDRLVCHMKSGVLAFGNPQVLPGYCVLYANPVVASLNALEHSARMQFLDDMARVGDALMEILSPARINYEILGNLEPALHAHIIPRYHTESVDLRSKPIWFYDWDYAPALDLKESRGLKLSLSKRLECLS